jgi:transcriptional accessory protein Tex/SPT6
MTMPEHEGLIGRIRQIRRVARAPDASRTKTAGDLDDGRVRALEARVAHLEQLVEGLQDSVHRQSERQGKLIAELRAQVQPGAMGAALAEDARNRGL